MKYLKYIEDWNIDVTKKFQSISEELSEEQLINYIKENCTEFLKDPKVITRSIRPDNQGKNWIYFDYFYSDPNLMNRKSDDCYNFYTLIIDNDPEWKDFPKRSKSFICTLGTSHLRGNRYYIIPKDGSKWGVCKKHDIFVCFDGGNVYSASQFVTDLYNFYYEIMKNSMKGYIFGERLKDNDYEEFISQLEGLNEQLKKMVWVEVNLSIKNKYFTSHFVTILKENFAEFYKEGEKGWSGDIVKIVKDYFSTHKFTVKSYGELRETPDLIYKKENIIQFETEITDFKEQEIWTQSPCIFIHKRKINDVLNKLF